MTEISPRSDHAYAISPEKHKTGKAKLDATQEEEEEEDKQTTGRRRGRRSKGDFVSPVRWVLFSKVVYWSLVSCLSCICLCQDGLLVSLSASQTHHNNGTNFLSA